MAAHSKAKRSKAALLFNESYDLGGRRSGLTTPGGQNVAWQFEGRGLPAVLNVDGSTMATFTYDLRGLLATRTLENGASSTYIYDAAARLQAMRGTVPVTYSLNAVGQRTGRHDPMGNRQRASDTAAVITAYTVRADNTYATGESVPVSLFGNRFLFTGRDHRRLGSLGGDCRRQPVGRDEQERASQHLSEVGLYDYRNRVYSAELGRFLQTDPIRFSAGDGNLYRYVSNNPVNLIDPLGLQAVTGVVGLTPEQRRDLLHGGDQEAMDAFDCEAKELIEGASDAAKDGILAPIPGGNIVGRIIKNIIGRIWKHNDPGEQFPE